MYLEGINLPNTFNLGNVSSAAVCIKERKIKRERKRERFESCNDLAAFNVFNVIVVQFN